MNKMTAIFLIASFLIVGCATPAYKEVFKEKPTYNQKEFSVSKDILYKAIIKAVCSKNFIIEKEEEGKGFILAKRYFQRGRRNIILALQAKIIPVQENKSVVYLNALETTEKLYIADRTRFFLFIIPLPGGGGKEASQIKEGEKIIKDEGFYQNFFSVIEDEIGILAKNP